MRGYNLDKLMSDRAVEDLKNGIVPKWMIDIPHHILVKYFFPQTFHHTGIDFKMTAFYNRMQVLAYFGVVKSTNYPTNPLAAAEFAQYLKEREPEEQVHEQVAKKTLPAQKKKLSRSEFRQAMGMEKRFITLLGGTRAELACGCEVCNFKRTDKLVARYRFKKVLVDLQAPKEPKKGVVVEIFDNGHCVVYGPKWVICRTVQVQVGSFMDIPSELCFPMQEVKDDELVRSLQDLLDEGLLASYDGLESDKPKSSSVAPKKSPKRTIKEKDKAPVMFFCHCGNCCAHEEKVFAYMKFSSVSLSPDASEKRQFVNASKKGVCVELLESGHCRVKIGQTIICMPEQVDVGALMTPEREFAKTNGLVSLKSFIEDGLPEFTKSEYYLVAPDEPGKEPSKVRLMCGCSAHSNEFLGNVLSSFRTDKAVINPISATPLEFESSRSRIHVELLGSDHCVVKAKDYLVCRVDQVEVGSLRPPKEKQTLISAGSAQAQCKEENLSGLTMM